MRAENRIIAYLIGIFISVNFPAFGGLAEQLEPIRHPRFERQLPSQGPNGHPHMVSPEIERRLHPDHYGTFDSEWKLRNYKERRQYKNYNPLLDSNNLLDQYTLRHYKTYDPLFYPNNSLDHYRTYDSDSRKYYRYNWRYYRYWENQN
jgi:hypothetical protein